MWDFEFDILKKYNAESKMEVLVNRIQIALDNTHEWMFYPWFREDLITCKKFLEGDFEIDVKDFREATTKLVQWWVLKDEPLNCNEKVEWVVINIEERANNLLKDQ